MPLIPKETYLKNKKWNNWTSTPIRLTLKSESKNYPRLVILFPDNHAVFWYLNMHGWSTDFHKKENVSATGIIQKIRFERWLEWCSLCLMNENPSNSKEYLRRSRRWWLETVSTNFIGISMGHEMFPHLTGASEGTLEPKHLCEPNLVYWFVTR